MEVETRAAASKVLEIVPLIMRFVSIELRRTGYALAPAHYRLLHMLARCPCSLSQLAERQAVSLPTMSNSVQTLVERGWVTRAEAAHDRRAVIVDLTPTGQSVLAETERQIEDRVIELLNPLSAVERETLVAGLAILRDAFVPVIQAGPARPAGESAGEKAG